MRQFCSYDFKHDFGVKLILLFVIALCAVNQPLNRKITKMVLCVKFTLEVTENCFVKLIPVL